MEFHKENTFSASVNKLPTPLNLDVYVYATDQSLPLRVCFGKGVYSMVL